MSECLLKRRASDQKSTMERGRGDASRRLYALPIRFLLAFALAIGLFPLPAFAAGSSVGSGPIVDIDATGQVGITEQADSTNATEQNNLADSSYGANLHSGATGDVTVLEQGDFGADGSLHWAYRDDASLVITGNGSMPNYTEEGGQPWAKYFALVESVIVEDGITAVGDYSFYEARIICSVDLPDTLVSIGRYAFAKISYLSSSIAKWNMVIPDSVTSIGDHAFYGCSNLYTCKLPDSMKELPESIFEFCENLSIQFPASLEVVGARAFKQAGNMGRLVEQTIPSSVRAIGDEAFYSTEWGTDLVLPGGLQSCGRNAFAFICLRHEGGRLVLGEGLTESVIKNCFNDIGIVPAIVLPASYTTISSNVLPTATLFYEVADDNPNYCAIGGVLFGHKSPSGTVYDNKAAVLLKMPKYQKGDYIVPSVTKEVPQDALSWYLTGLTLPASLVAFRDDLNGSDITEINVDVDNQVFKSIDGILYSKDGTELIKCPRMKAFGDNFSVPSGVTRLGARAFDQSQLHGITLPAGLKTIGSQCFDRCYMLSCVYLPQSVSTVSANSFINGTSNVRGGFTVFFEGTQDEWSRASYDSCLGLANAEKIFSCKAGGQTKDALLFCISHDGILSVRRDNLRNEYRTVISDYEEGTQEWAGYSNDITSVVVGEYVTEVGANTFSGLVNAERVLLPSEIEKVAGDAFAACPSLKDVECLGLPFDARDATIDTPSFPASVCMHYKGDYAQQWLADSNFDVSQGTWRGYAVAEDESIGLPVIGRIQLDRTAMHAKGADQDYYDTDIWTGYAVYDAEGNDITSYVTVTVKDPERTTGVLSPTKTRPYQSFWVAEEHMQHSKIDEREHIIHFPRAGVAGDYIVTATPNPGKVAGNPVTQAVPLTRDGEAIYGVDMVGFGLYGKAARFLVLQRPFDVYNQYGETVLNRVSVRIIDRFTGEYLENGNNDYGLYIEPSDQFKMRHDNRALPGEFSLEITPNDANLHGAKLVNFETGRAGSFINQPFTMTLGGGEDEMIVQDAGQWACSPYRVRIYDCYDDPVWPEITWHITDSDGNDVTDGFTIDGQGYLQIGQEIFDKLSADRATRFSIKASTPGVKSSIEAQEELGYDDSYTGPWCYPVEIELESNELTLSLRREQPPAPVTHTATFVVGDVVIGQVAFAEGDTSLDEPAIPQKQNYVGSWEPYNLAEATGDITIQGVYRPIDPSEVSDIEASADSSYENGEVAITLTAAARSKQVRVESQTTKPVDVVLVLDQSGSMDEPLGSTSKKKRDALVECAQSFVESLYDNAIKTGADHRVALVGFAMGDEDASGYPKYLNTELLATTQGGKVGYNAGAIKESTYKQALIPIAVNGELSQRVTQGISSIAAKGATAADLGLKMAKNIYAANPVATGDDGPARERVVVFITDGVPTSMSTSSSQKDRNRVTSTAANAISMAYDMKASQGVRIYSIGVDELANPSTSFSSAKDGIIGSKRTLRAIQFWTTTSIVSSI